MKSQRNLNDQRDRAILHKAKEVLNAKLLDIAGPLDFQDQYGNFNTLSGPIHEGQIGQFFDRKEGLPAVGLFFDIDY